MDGLTLFGLVAVSAMLVFYALEERSHWYVLAFAGACALGSAYGFLQGAWPFGVIEAIWAAIALRRWRGRASRQAARRLDKGCGARVTAQGNRAPAPKGDAAPPHSPPINPDRE